MAQQSSNNDETCLEGDQNGSELPRARSDNKLFALKQKFTSAKSLREFYHQRKERLARVGSDLKENHRNVQEQPASDETRKENDSNHVQGFEEATVQSYVQLYLNLEKRPHNHEQLSEVQFRKDRSEPLPFRTIAREPIFTPDRMSRCSSTTSAFISDPNLVRPYQLVARSAGISSSNSIAVISPNSHQPLNEEEEPISATDEQPLKCSDDNTVTTSDPPSLKLKKGASNVGQDDNTVVTSDPPSLKLKKGATKSHGKEAPPAKGTRRASRGSKETGSKSDRVGETKSRLRGKQRHVQSPPIRDHSGGQQGDQENDEEYHYDESFSEDFITLDEEWLQSEIGENFLSWGCCTAENSADPFYRDLLETGVTSAKSAMVSLTRVGNIVKRWVDDAQQDMSLDLSDQSTSYLSTPTRSPPARFSASSGGYGSQRQRTDDTKRVDNTTQRMSAKKSKAQVDMSSSFDVPKAELIELMRSTVSDLALKRQLSESQLDQVPLELD